MELKHYIGAKIKEYRKDNKMTQQDLADRLNTTKQTIGRYEKGTRKVNQDILFKLCDIFHVTLDDFFPTDTIDNYGQEDTLLNQITDITAQLTLSRQNNVYNYASTLLDEQNNVYRLTDYSKSNSVDLMVSETSYGYVSAGNGQEVLDDVSQEVYIPSNLLPREHYDIMLQVSGNSMEPMFKNGEYIFVRKTDEVFNGQLAVIVINNESYIKKVYIEEKQLRLVSLNPEYEDLIFTNQDEIKLIGTVVM